MSCIFQCFKSKAKASPAAKYPRGTRPSMIARIDPPTTMGSSATSTFGRSTVASTATNYTMMARADNTHEFYTQGRALPGSSSRSIYATPAQTSRVSGMNLSTINGSLNSVATPVSGLSSVSLPAQRASASSVGRTSASRSTGVATPVASPFAPTQPGSRAAPTISMRSISVTPASSAANTVHGTPTPTPGSHAAPTISMRSISVTPASSTANTIRGPPTSAPGSRAAPTISMRSLPMSPDSSIRGTPSTIGSSSTEAAMHRVFDSHSSLKPMHARNWVKASPNSTLKNADGRTAVQASLSASPRGVAPRGTLGITVSPYRGVPWNAKARDYVPK